MIHMNALEKYRQDHDLSCVEMAAIVGCRHSTISRHCNDKRPISGDFVLLYHAKFGIPLHELRPDIFEKDDQQNEPEK